MTSTCCSMQRPWFKATGSALPGVLAILLPKCPLCVAAWVAACTGVALPAMLAASVRPALAIACVLSAALLLRRLIGSKGPYRSPETVPLTERHADDS